MIEIRECMSYISRQYRTMLKTDSSVHNNLDNKRNVKYRRENTIRQYCTSISRQDIKIANSLVAELEKNKQQTRYIHPQVLKMFRRAQDLIRLGDHSIASKLLIRCLELNQYDSHSWLALARLEAKLCNYQRSREIFSQAVQKCPQNVHILHAWGHMEERHGSESIARECWSQAMEIEPCNAYVCHALSNLERRLHNYKGAQRVLENVIKVKPTSPLCVSLAEIERLQGEPEKARETILYGLKKCTSDRSKLYLALAWLEEDAFKNFFKAKKYIQDAIVNDSQNVRCYIAKASYELRQHEIENARKTLHLACNLKFAEDGQHYTMLSTLEYDQNNIPEAIRVLEEGARKFPGDQYLIQRWGAIESKTGNIQKARELFKKSVDIKPHAPTFVAWAILEEEEGSKALSPNIPPVRKEIPYEDIENVLKDITMISSNVQRIDSDNSLVTSSPNLLPLQQQLQAQLQLQVHPQ